MSLPLPKALDDDARSKKKADDLLKYIKNNLYDCMSEMKKKELAGKMKGKNTLHEATKKCANDFLKQYKG